MEKKQLHPSVESFKAFMYQHPELMSAVRRQEYTLQELYEDWYLLGEDDPRWHSYQEGQSKSDKKPSSESASLGWVDQFIGKMKNMDGTQVERFIQNASQTLGTIQGLLGQFQSSGQGASNEQTPQPKNPFAFRKD